MQNLPIEFLNVCILHEATGSPIHWTRLVSESESKREVKYMADQ